MNTTKRFFFLKKRRKKNPWGMQSGKFQIYTVAVILFLFLCLCTRQMPLLFDFNLQYFSFFSSLFSIATDVLLLEKNAFRHIQCYGFFFIFCSIRSLVSSMLLVVFFYIYLLFTWITQSIDQSTQFARYSHALFSYNV